MRQVVYRVGQITVLSAAVFNINYPFKMSLGSLLHDAISNGDVDRVEKLIQDGADVNKVYARETPFTRAMDLCNNHISEILMNSNTFDPNAKNQIDRTPSFYAAKFDKASMLDRLKSLGGELDVPDIRGVTPLGATAWYDAWKSANTLIQNGANVNNTDVKGETVLHRACSHVCSHVVKLLLDNGCFVNAQNKLGQTPLMMAIPSKYEIEINKKRLTDMIEIIILLLKHNANPSLQDNSGKTALHYAIDVNDFHSACLLMRNGCDLNKRTNKGLSPLHLAISPEAPRYEIALCLLYYGCDANSKLVDNETEKELLPITVVVQSKTSNLQNEQHRQKLIDALIMATDFSNYDLSELKEENSNLPNFGKHGLTESWPFSFQHQCKLAIRRTLASDVLPKIDLLPLGWCMKRYLALDCDYKRYHPLTIAELHTAVTDNDTETIKQLITCEQVDLNTPLNNNTPLTLAAKHGHIEATTLLLNNKAEVDKLDPNGANALHVAASNGKSELLQVLILNTNAIDGKNSQNETPLLQAAANGQFDAAILLCLNSSNPSLTGNTQIPAIHFASGSGHVQATTVLADAGADLSAVDSNGNTALNIAASRGILYLRNNIRLPALYKNKTLEMMDAVKMIILDSDPKYTATDNVDHVEVVKCLLAKGCDPRIVNQDSKNALDISHEFGFHEVNKILREWINEHS